MHVGQSRAKWQAVILLSLLGVGAWHLLKHGDEPATGERRAAGTEVRDTSKPGSVPENGGARSIGPEQKPGRENPDLGDVKSPIARRYLAYLLAQDGRFVKDRNGLWLVNNAFEQAWMLTSRMDLGEEQQDRLAEFLLEVDSFSWMLWEKIDPERTNAWVKNNLSAEQQATFWDLLAEQKDGFAGMTAYLVASEKICGNPNDEKAKQLSPEAQKELGKSVVNQALVYQDYNILADRIPMTAEQQEKVLDALRAGAKPPVAAEDYEMLDPERAEAAVRADTRWLGDMIPEARYEAYLRHLLAQIEMRRFHQNRP